MESIVMIDGDLLKKKFKIRYFQQINQSQSNLDS